MAAIARNKKRIADLEVEVAELRAENDNLRARLAEAAESAAELKKAPNAPRARRA